MRVRAVALVLAGLTAGVGGIVSVEGWRPEPGPVEPIDGGTWMAAERAPVRDLSLVDHSGRPFTEERLAGRWTVVFVGYTSCPDVCPLSLSGLAASLDVMAARGSDDVQAVFLSVDPERDSLEALAAYVGYFHPDLIGVTGERDAIDRAVAAIGGGYALRPGEGGSYLVDHSTSAFLVDPTANVVAYLLRPSDGRQLAADLDEARAGWTPAVTLQGAWVRAAAPGAPASAAYGTFVGTGGAPATQLDGLSSSAFASSALHRTVVEDGMASMRPAGVLTVSGDRPLVLEPGGLHLMLFDPNRPLQDGDAVVLRARFADGSDELHTAPVRRTPPPAAGWQ